MTEIPLVVTKSDLNRIIKTQIYDNQS